MNTNALLVEFGCEELPPKSLKILGASFGASVETELKEARFTFSKLRWFATPRRLAVQVLDLTEKQSDVVLVKKGPPLQAAYDKEGNPTKAALGWAKSNNIVLDDAQIVETPKGKWLQVKLAEEGKNLDSCLTKIINTALNQLPIAKVMRWGNKDHQFVRPVHNICCLYGDTIVPLSLLGIESNNKVLGHRFHSTGLHELRDPLAYEDLLRTLKVIVDFEARKSVIMTQLNKEAVKDNAKVSMDESLLDEVTSLVEWPILLKATFEESFLAVPKEALIYTMKDDQKYFPLLDNNTGELLNAFYLISNIESSNPKTIIEGNEKVVRPRLADAEFFFKLDLNTSIDTRLNSLKSIVYQKQLGTVYDKSLRIAKLSRKLAELLNLGSPSLAYRAGEICKSDLTSKMVFEFPEVQGFMGAHYALHGQEDKAVATAIRDHYKPKGIDDGLPTATTSQAVALADKLDTLVGIFGIGQKPKGDKDPFALRRAVLGIVKILIKFDIRLNLVNAITLATDGYPKGVLTNVNLSKELLEFFHNRIENLFVDQGVGVNIVRSVLLTDSKDLVQVKEKLEALITFIGTNKEVVESLIASNKRIANILKKSTDVVSGTINVDLFECAEEKDLHSTLVKVKDDFMTKNLSYSERLVQLAKFKDPINRFFDNVMVNVDQDNVKTNRVLMLKELRTEFLAIADFSLIQG